MSPVHGLHLRSRLDATGELIVTLDEQALPAPTGEQVLMRVDAAPINPSDLGLLYASADLENAHYASRCIVARMPEASRRNMTARFGKALPVGNEGAGVVIAAGEAPAAQALLGKLVTSVAGGMFAQHRLLRASECTALPDGVDAEQGASAFVNPMTALAFVETMRHEGHSAIVHTAAASTLGQMLVRICKEDGVPLVNIVRRDDQAGILRALGAEHVLNSSSESFAADLTSALRATGATLVFDAIGGGDLLNRVLGAMERVAREDAEYSRYGATRSKQAYVYGALDVSPTVLVGRDIGFAWNVGGWLLGPFLAKTDAATIAAMRARVMAGLSTTFATAYQARIHLADILNRDVVLRYNARRTGEKFMVLPNA